MDSAECRWGQVLQCHIPGLTRRSRGTLQKTAAPLSFCVGLEETKET
jgi:hypothetical protein